MRSHNWPVVQRHHLETAHDKPDAQEHLPDAEYIKRGVEFGAPLTGIETTKWSNGDVLYVVDTTSGNIPVILPPVQDCAGQFHMVKRITGGGNTCVVSSDAGTLDGTASYSIATQYLSVTFVSDGEDWHAV